MERERDLVGWALAAAQLLLAGGERRGRARGRAPGASTGGERRERARGASAGGEVRWAAAQSARAGGGGAPSVVARGARKGINRAMGSGAG